MLDVLKDSFSGFISKIEAEVDVEQVLPGISDSDIQQLEDKLGLTLPESYKAFLTRTGGFILFGGSVQFCKVHPFLHNFPALDELSPAQQEMLKRKGGGWPPPSNGMLCFAEYFRDADGDQVLFDLSNGLIDGEYPVVYYSHDSRPPSVTKLADSFSEWLNHYCIDQME